MKFTVYIFLFLFVLSSCKSSWQKSLGTYKSTLPVSSTNELAYLNLNKEGICILSIVDSSLYSVWRLKDDTVSIYGLGQSDSISYVLNKRRLTVINQKLPDSVVSTFKKTRKGFAGTSKCTTADCVYISIIQSADKMYQVARTNRTVSMLRKAGTLYARALSIKPNEQYPKDQIKSIRQVLDR